MRELACILRTRRSKGGASACIEAPPMEETYGASNDSRTTGRTLPTVQSNVGSRGGGVRSTDGGDSWQDFSTGIFHPRLYSLAMTSPGLPRLIAGSLGSGLYWTALTVADRIRRPSGRRSP